MTTFEHVHRYPRRVELLTELLSAAAVAVSMALFGREMLLLYWQARGVDTSMFSRIPQLRPLVINTVGTLPSGGGSLFAKGGSLLVALTLLALALLAALLVRYGLPAVRTGARGMLVEFAGAWLPLPWESVSAIKVTDVDNRFVLLIETDWKHLTGWHCFYSLLYRLGLRPGFLVTSAISDFDELVKTLLAETDRAARVLSSGRGAQLQEEASSPFFRLLLSPGSFFSQKAAADPQAPRPTAAPSARDDVVTGSYPGRIGSLLRWGAYVLAALFGLRYLALMLTGLALIIPGLALVPPFTWLELSAAPGWWPFIAAQLLALAAVPIVSGVRYLLPDVAARRDGLAVRYFRKWHVVPWSQLTSVKVTELSESSQVVIVQVRGGLPYPARIASLLYDGSLRPGVLVTSAMSAFEPFLQRIILEVMGGPATAPQAEASPIFQSDARSDLLLGLLSPTHAIDRAVEEARADASTLQTDTGRLLRAAGPMARLALVPALILLADLAIQQRVMPDARTVIAAVALFLFGMLEWPIIALAAITLDESSGGGEDGARPWYLYPPTQLPRIAALLGILAVVLIGVPYVSSLGWLAMLVWIFTLAAGLWGALYDWRGGLLLTGGLIPVFFQMMVLIGYLVLRR